MMRNLLTGQAGMSVVSLLVGIALTGFVMLASITSTTFVQKGLKGVERSFGFSSYVDRVTRYLADEANCSGAVAANPPLTYDSTNPMAFNIKTDGYEVDPAGGFPGSQHEFEFTTVELNHLQDVVTLGWPKQALATLTVQARRVDRNGAVLDADNTLGLTIPLTIWYNSSNLVTKCHGKGLFNVAQQCPMGSIQWTEDDIPDASIDKPTVPLCGFNQITAGVDLATLPAAMALFTGPNQFYSRDLLRAGFDISFIRHDGSDPVVRKCNADETNCRDICLITEDGVGGTNCTPPAATHPDNTLAGNPSDHHHHVSRCDFTEPAVQIDVATMAMNEVKCVSAKCAEDQYVHGHFISRPTPTMWRDQKHLTVSQDLDGDGLSGVRFCVQKIFNTSYFVNVKARCCDKRRDPPFEN